MSLQIIKFKNGEDIVCRVIGDGDGFLKIENPLQMHISPIKNEEGYGEHVAMSRWMQPYTEETVVRVRKDSIVTVVTASKGMAAFYQKMLRQNTVDKMEPGEFEDDEDFDDNEDRMYH